MEAYFIYSGAIGLRHLNLEDGEAFLRWHNDYELRGCIGGIFPFGSNTFKEICQSGDEQYPYNVWFAVCESGRLIGIAGLHSIKYVQRNAELSILIGEKEDRRKGRGGTVLTLLEEYAFGMLGLHRLYALVYSDNYPAMDFFKKSGWEMEGILKEAAYWEHQFRNVAVWAKRQQCI